MMMEMCIFLFLMLLFLDLFLLGNLFMVFLYLIFLFNLDSISKFIVMGLGSWYGMDYFTFYMVIMGFWLISIIYIFEFSWGVRILLLLFFFLMNCMFQSLNLIHLFLFFEASIVPIFIMLLLFGLSKERYFSGLYLFVYTLFSSLPSLLMIIYITLNLWNLSIFFLYYISLNFDWGLSVIILIMFLVKVPGFIFHIWLPKAHVEAPVYGSMVLAALMLKMGGYGILRLKLVFNVSLFQNDLIISLSLIGGLILSITCFFQSDLKVLVAYSSVIHMCLMLISLFSGVELSVYGGILMMFSHGICSSCLFYMVNLIYSMTGSRLIYFSKGIHIILPMYSFLWLLVLMNNLGVPPCFSFISEILCFIGVLMYSMSLFIFLILMIFFISVFSMVLMFLSVCSGSCSNSYSKFSLSVINYLIIFIHLIPLNFLIIFLVDLF